MSGQQIGDHDPVVMGAPRLGIWIECECGWISASYFTEDAALRVHEHHASKTASVTS